MHILLLMNIVTNGYEYTIMLFFQFSYKQNEAIVFFYIVAVLSKLFGVI